jgi:hypothetical protein
MDLKNDKKLIYQALNAGCKTMAELAHYLKHLGAMKIA